MHLGRGDGEEQIDNLGTRYIAMITRLQSREGAGADGVGE